MAPGLSVDSVMWRTHASSTTCNEILIRSLFCCNLASSQGQFQYDGDSAVLEFDDLDDLAMQE